MAAKQLKELIKKIKLNIKSEEYDEAKSLCEDALDIDKENYNVHVFLGVVHAKSGNEAKAEEAYCRATELEPAQKLAWEGLRKLYEKSTDNSAIKDRDRRLLEVYQKLVSFSDDQAKVSELHVKIGELLVELDLTDEAFKFFCEQFEAATGDDASLVATRVVKYGLRLERQRVKDHLKTKKIVNATKRDLEKGRLDIAREQPEQFELVTKCMRASIDQDENPDELVAEIVNRTQTMCGALGQRCSTVMKECVDFLEKYPKNIRLLEFLLEVSLRDGLTMEEEALHQYASTLTSINAHSPQALAVLGTHAYVSGDGQKGLSMLEEAVTNDSNCLRAVVQLCKISIKTFDIENCIKFATAAIDTISTWESTLGGNQWWNEIWTVIRMCEGKACLESFGRLSQALAAYNAVLARCPQNVEAISGLAEVSLAEGNMHQAKIKAKEALSLDETCVAAVSAFAWTAFHERDFKTAESLLRQAITINAKQSLIHYRLGRVIWENGSDDKGNSIKSFILAVKCDSYNSHAFEYLGHYYAETKATARAVKCYEKCISLSPSSFGAAEALVAIYSKSEDWPNVHRVSSLVTSIAAGSQLSKVTWAWKALARVQQRMDKLDEAVFSSQTAIRTAPEDADCWLMLGESYLKRGSYLAASKALEKSMEYDADNLYCIYKFARVKQALGQLQEAIENCECILRKLPNYLPATIVLAEVWFIQAKEYLTDNIVGVAIEALQMSLNYCSEALSLSNKFGSVWKCLGDTCCLVRSLAPRYSTKVSIPTRLKAVIAESFPNDEEPQDLLGCGTLAYKRVVTLENTATAWGDLTANYLFRIQADRSCTEDGILASALSCAKRCVSLDVTNAESWNILGAVANVIDNLPLAQHAFVKSINIDPNSSQTWANLGALYLRCKDYELANKAFSMAQAVEPSLSRAWVGQAMVAECYSLKDALDLYRHAYELYPNPQACLGFGYHVVSATTTSIEEENRPKNDGLPLGYEDQYVEQAIVALKTYLSTAQGCANAQAYNCLAILEERRTFLDSSARLYDKAMSLLVSDKLKAREHRTVQLNLARVLAARQDTKQSVDMYRIAGIEQLHDICGLGYAAYKAADFTTSYTVYQKALDVAQTSSDQEGATAVTVAMAMVAAANQEYNLAKKLLAGTIQTAALCPRLLFVMCVLGVVTDDGELAISSLVEFERLVSKGTPNIDNYRENHARLKSILYQQQNQVLSALQSMSKAIHLYPNKTNLWCDVAALLCNNPDILQHSIIDSSSTDPYSVCAESAQQVRGQQGDTTPGRNLTLLSAGEILSGSRRKYESAVATAAKAVHENPESIETWAMLSAAAYAQGVTSLNAKNFETSVVAADTCAVLCESESCSEKKNKRLLHWVQVQSCESRCAWASLVEPSIALPLLSQTAIRCQEAARNYIAAPHMAKPFYFIYAKCLFSFGQANDGFKTLSSCLRVESESPLFWEAGGSLYESLGLYNEAKLCFKQCISVTSVTSTLGKVRPQLRLAIAALQKHQDLDEAFEAITNAVRLQKEIIAARLCLGIVRCARGDLKAGRKELTRVADSLGFTKAILEEFA